MHTYACITYAELLPNDVTCAKETRDLIIECCVGPSSLYLTVPNHISLANRSLLLSLSVPCGPSFFLGLSFLEFIHLISSEANEICEQDSKKTIAPDHIIGALKVCPQFHFGSPLAPIVSRIINFGDRTPEARLRVIHRGGRRRPQGP
jgi:hypothetical protein